MKKETAEALTRVLYDLNLFVTARESGRGSGIWGVEFSIWMCDQEEDTWEITPELRSDIQALARALEQE